MKLKKFDEFENTNEAILGDFARLRTGSREETKGKIAGRMTDDNYAWEVFEDMKKDFIQNGKDLRKTMTMSDDNTIVYIFGKFDTIKNSPMSFGGVGHKKVRVVYIPAEIKLKRDSLDKAFGIGRGFESATARMEIKETLANPNYNPNISANLGFHERPSDKDREMMRSIDSKEEYFKITYDVAKKIIKYFIDEWNKQYPQLKNAKYRNSMNISEIEKGEKPNLGYVDVFDKNKQEIIYGYSDLKDKKKIENYIKNHVCIKGKSKENYPVTYFTENGEDIEEAKDLITTLTKSEIEKINKDRINEEV